MRRTLPSAATAPVLDFRVAYDDQTAQTWPDTRFLRPTARVHFALPHRQPRLANQRAPPPSNALESRVGGPGVYS
ncbi:hypothetical protein IMZ48_42210 [Candidatus Bathyarchaeota archaeon]|nr:hypothetical protein [Candidatus Bathyarchaeota archaeon]